MHPALAGHLLQARQLGQRIGVVVDAQVVERIVLAVVDQQRRRLRAALVAAGRLAGPHGRQQAPREGQRALGLVGADRLGQHGRPGQHVAGDGVGLAQLMAAPVDAGGTRVGGEPALPGPSRAAGGCGGPRRPR